MCLNTQHELTFKYVKQAGLGADTSVGTYVRSIDRLNLKIKL